MIFPAISVEVHLPHIVTLPSQFEVGQWLLLTGFFGSSNSFFKSQGFPYPIISAKRKSAAVLVDGSGMSLSVCKAPTTGEPEKSLNLPKSHCVMSGPHRPDELELESELSELSEEEPLLDCELPLGLGCGPLLPLGEGPGLPLGYGLPLG